MTEISEVFALRSKIRSPSAFSILLGVLASLYSGSASANDLACSVGGLGSICNDYNGLYVPLVPGICKAGGSGANGTGLWCQPVNLVPCQNLCLNDYDYFYGAPAPNGMACTSPPGGTCACGTAALEFSDAVCNAAPPPPPGTCGAAGPPWANHVCGTGGCAPSALPTPVVSGLPAPLPAGTTFDNLSNKMAACCGSGWGENNNEAKKMDCVEAVPQPNQTFLQFYNFNDTTANADRTTGGVPFPNRMFVVGSDGIPLNGFYTQSGKRCHYRDPTTKNPIQQTRSQQMALFDAALAASKVPSGGSAEVDPLCCNLVLFALERKCPGVDSIGGVTVATTDSGTRRCTAASSMKLDLAVIDLCDSSVVNRGRFRIATSFFNGAPGNTTYLPSAAIEVQNLIKEFYPAPSPTPSVSPAPACPGGAIIEIPWSGGLCDLATPRPSPSP